MPRKKSVRKAKAQVSKRIKINLIRNRNELKKNLEKLKKTDAEFKERRKTTTPIDSATEVLEIKNSKMISRLVRKLKEVDESIKRINLGKYGICEDCNEPIPLARLEAVPSAKRCFACADFNKQAERSR